MRLIDADKLIEICNKGWRLGGAINTKIYHTVDASDIRSQPTVEAIPVEWIKKWAKKNGLDCYDYDYPTEKNEWWYAIEKMLEDWEKENGTRNTDS